MKASHTFNLLDARHAISVTERQRLYPQGANDCSSSRKGYVAARAKLVSAS